MYDFHTHTFLSDGELSPMELISRAYGMGYRVIVVTDHVGPGNLEFVLNTLAKECEMASRRWDILALPGVEVTYVPKEDIASFAKEARAAGARIVNVHGETIVEPVEPGINLAAVSSGQVDVLAHPGLITPEEAGIASRNGVFLEVSGRQGHSFANGHVVKAAQRAGAPMILDSDAHAPGDLMTRKMAMEVALGAGLDEDQALALLDRQPLNLLEKIGVPSPTGA